MFWKFSEYKGLHLKIPQCKHFLAYDVKTISWPFKKEKTNVVTIDHIFQEVSRTYCVSHMYSYVY